MNGTMTIRSAFAVGAIAALLCACGGSQLSGFTPKQSTQSRLALTSSGGYRVLYVFQ